MAKALVLLSGGLDSILAAKVLQAQGIEVVGICFTSNFFSCAKAQIAAKQIGIDLKVVDISADILALVKNPPSGLGKNMNPCIDCHSLMIRKAAEFLKPPCQRGIKGVSVAKNINPPAPLYQGGILDRYDFIATGEVLGQRPFSQNKLALERVAKLAGIEVLRPLSAKLLPETGMEKSGLVNRALLLDLCGRNRARQLELVRQFEIKEFPMPAGGCILTDPEFSSRLEKMIEYWPKCDNDDIELLKIGRIFWFNLADLAKTGKVLLVIGRNEAENARLNALAKKGDFVVELIHENGPTALLRTKMLDLKIKSGITAVSIPDRLKLAELDFNMIKDNSNITETVRLLNGYYSPRLRGKNIEIEIRSIS